MTLAMQSLILLISAGAAFGGLHQEFLPDGSLRPGTRVTIPAGQEEEFLFRPEGVRFLSGRARIMSESGLLTDAEGRLKTEIVIDADDASRGTPWMHDEKPFRLWIRAETDFTLEARESASTEARHRSPYLGRPRLGFRCYARNSWAMVYFLVREGLGAICFLLFLPGMRHGMTLCLPSLIHDL